MGRSIGRKRKKGERRNKEKGVKKKKRMENNFLECSGARK